ncbi:MAG: adenylosuccinate lyase [Candidatus Terrybacteria bacterium RIFCSPLOWO2_01_FULL_44_24]|uniref:Adenylosuccinate lyase n=1 Tax=Candidatus Terrybacteria bacterium RIFCSPHIGHO2_01_FULL_43_35 TaxID=1802361 RepID=A0A1G2PFK4_9BACT|nr:MAG: adenylosuccinate lyase [Candidatus Terrybacteria bacterium RIFCSPHIGHO2_01_FULL_43_35]OHA49887.1 MAG: adenylosuccinate lyase [Candidatus Terrybacteria bacterium RIFCSPHIGHO2_02_FULL_43_14]OHA51792.1 MAG: adenylosuccinate lyase [Candidatus Terrybacteria bacterium RIFCSPLOWO2_01_FULL_44_24]
MDKFEALSPVDGRYGGITSVLSDYFSEFAFTKYRIMVEAEYLLAFLQHPKIAIRSFSEQEIKFIRDLRNISKEDFLIIKTLETMGYGGRPATKHDMKAIEYFIKDKFEATSLKDCIEWVHFALTSEDVNNIAYALMMPDAINKILLPAISEIHDRLEVLAKQNKDIVMLARTHGQSASPTTLGKEFKVFASRLNRQIIQFKDFNLSAKLNGAVGNYNAHLVAFPQVDWIGFSRDFIHSLDRGGTVKLVSNTITTQIEPHDSEAELFDLFRRINVILIDLVQDMWRYISDGWLGITAIDGEIGSSTMPHKINPIDFENAEGNLGLANALFGHFSEKLPISRLQRDLSDSTVARNFGVAFGHSLIAYKAIMGGMDKIYVDNEKISQDLAKHPEIIAEGLQIILRRHGVEMSYEALKKITRGKEISNNDLAKFINDLNISDDIKKELRNINLDNYTGMASVLAGNDF